MWPLVENCNKTYREVRASYMMIHSTSAVCATAVFARINWFDQLQMKMQIDLICFKNVFMYL